MQQTISIIGLGYIGLPLALCYCENGFRVIGVDVNSEKIEALLRGETAVEEMCGSRTLQDLLKEHVHKGTFVPTTQVAQAAGEVNTYVVTVGIPVQSSGVVNDAPLLGVMEQLGAVLNQGDLVLIRSTLVPGMLESLLLPALAHSSKMTPGVDFKVAYASERVAEGRAMEEFQTIDIVVGGLTEKCTAAAAEVLSRLTAGAIHVTDLRTAQIVKVIENAQRDVNIALAQEIAKVAEEHGVDAYELIRMANTHPRVKLLQPGIGVGGFCIPNAYPYLSASMKSEDTLPLFRLSRTINANRPKQLVERLEQLLAGEGIHIHDSTIAVLGLGMKENSNDIRQSPAISIVNQLLGKGAVVRAYDPLVPLQLPCQTKTLKECLYQADGVVVACWHDEFDDHDFSEALAASRVHGAVIDLKARLADYLPAVMQFDDVVKSV